MKERYRLRHARANDIEAMRDVLKHCELSILGIENPENIFILTEKDENITGMLGSICFGTQALLRSFAVKKHSRRNGIGIVLLEEMEAKLQDKGIKEIFLLTETAADYFVKAGFNEIPRGKVPKRLLQISELEQVCSCSSRSFHRILK